MFVNKTNQEHEAIISQLQSKIKKLQVTTNTMEQCLQQKILENEQISSICDDLINKKRMVYNTNKNIVQ